MKFIPFALAALVAAPFASAATGPLKDKALALQSAHKDSVVFISAVVELEVTAGDSAKLDAAPPNDLPSLMAAFRKLLPGTVWAVTIYPADEGVALDGKLVRDLPPSALDKLHPQSHTQRAQAYKPIARTVAPAKRVVNGQTSMLVRVRAAD